MTGLGRVALIIAAGALAGGASADAEQAALQGGSYAVTFRLEIPHVENWAIDKTTTICVPNTRGASDAPLPVLSGNNPLAKCPARKIERDGATLRYEIACPGRNEARARAVYALTPWGFKGRIAMVMGAKNMTMTEVQIGRRLGSCDLARQD
jgi:uncharacterized protein DUF3617